MLKFLVNSSKRYKGVNTENWSEAVFCKLCWYRCSDFILKLYLNTARQFKQKIVCILYSSKCTGTVSIKVLPLQFKFQRQSLFSSSLCWGVRAGLFTCQMYFPFLELAYTLYMDSCVGVSLTWASLCLYLSCLALFLCLPFINVPDLIISLFSLSLNGWNDRDRKYYSGKHVLESFDIAT